MALELLSIFRNRGELLDQLGKKSSCEVLVVGGGIHGAAFARVAVLNGLDTILLERHDYAAATSSRSSKMVHGGLRYLESLDFRQVYEGIQAREELFRSAAHVVKPQPFLIPFFTDQAWLKTKLGAGLCLYDLMRGKREHRHSWVNSQAWLAEALHQRSGKLTGCFRYVDGLMNDFRLTLENIIAARQEGALCLNHTSVEHIGVNPSGRVEVFWKDGLSGRSGSVEAGIAVSCSGPWAPFIGKHRSAALADMVCFSQGAHLLFRQAWKHEALLLPMEQSGRYYFVWPHLGGTLVGTTERLLEQIEDDPQPTVAEIEEILTRVQRDLPGSGLNRSTLHYAFAGVRTMARRRKPRSRHPSRISRRHVWHYERGVLSLIGGKFTTAQWTAEEGLKRVFELAKLKSKMVCVRGRELPGTAALKDAIRAFTTEGKRRGIEEHVLERCVSRLGSWVRLIGSAELTESTQASWDLLGGNLLRGELELAAHIEQAETLEDFMRRRLELEYLPGHGLEVLDAVIDFLKKHRPGLDLATEQEKYRTRLENLHKIMGISNLQHQLPELLP